MDTIGKKLGLKEKMAYGCGDAASRWNLKAVLSRRDRSEQNPLERS